MNNLYVTYVLWSGGLDSTYMIQKLLEDDSNRIIHASYIEILNNENKTKSEIKAIEKLEPIFRSKFPDRFFFKGTAYKIEVINISDWIGLRQIPVWFGAIMLTTPSGVKEVCIGYIMNDCAISYLNEFKGIFKQYSKLCDKPFPKIIFPLSKINKDMIVDKIDSRLKEYVVSCEMPIVDGENLSPCGHCVSCQHNPLLPPKKMNVEKEFSETFNKSKELVQGQFDFDYSVKGKSEEEKLVDKLMIAVEKIS